MRYHQYGSADDGLAAGDICRCTLNVGEHEEAFYAIVVGTSRETVTIRRLHKADSGGARYILRDLASTGLDYAMFVDTGTTTVARKAIGRKVGKISKSDKRNLRI